MKEVGTILHLARSGRMILKLQQKTDAGTVVVDDRGRDVARIVELIGPISAPYASAIPLTDRIKRAAKGKVYVK